jgi:hypothetical protein
MPSEPPQKIRKFSVVWIFILQICSPTSAPILLALWMFICILNMQWETGLVQLAKIRSASPIRRDNAYL